MRIRFGALNDWLVRESIDATYQFNMLTPKDFGKYFTQLRSGQFGGFRSELDVKIAQEHSNEQRELAKTAV